MFTDTTSKTIFINFAGGEKIYNRVNKINLLIFNEKGKLLDKRILYEKFFSNLNDISKLPGKIIMNEYNGILFFDTKTRISLLFLFSSEVYHFFTIGIFKSNVFKCIQNNLILTNIEFIINYSIDWDKIIIYSSKEIFINLLQKFLNQCNSYLLLTELT